MSLRRVSVPVMVWLALCLTVLEADRPATWISNAPPDGAVDLPWAPLPIDEKIRLAGARLDPVEPREVEKPKPRPHLTAAIEASLPITSKPGRGRTIGTMPAGSPFYGVPHRAWILERSANERFGRVVVPYSARRAAGWIRIQGLKFRRTPISVHADLSEVRIVVKRLDEKIFSVMAATGTPESPTPTGRYFVTDLAPFEAGSPLGSFAFGISGIQPNLPAGWTGADQLAIHGTNDPSSIGTRASAGCLRVSEGALDRMKPLVDLGTPVIIRR